MPRERTNETSAHFVSLLRTPFPFPFWTTPWQKRAFHSTHARAKLKHTAFIELNQQVVLPVVSQKTELKRWRGHRLFGHDSSLIRLPESQELADEFGEVESRNQRGATGTTYPEGRISVLYDLLNRIGVDARLESSRVGEVSLAIEQALQVPRGEVAINDRGFTGFRYLAEHVQRGVHVVGRCSSGSFGAAQEMFRKNRAGRSKIVKLFAPADQRAQLKALGLPLELTVRFISLRLPDGKLEVLVTTLLDEHRAARWARSFLVDSRRAGVVC